MANAPQRPVIDMHHHFIPVGVFERLVEMAGGATRLITPEISITLNPVLHRPEAHLEAMDHAGITTAVLSNSGLNFMGLDVCRALNDGIAAVVRAHPDRFIGTAHLPAEAGAVEELDRCLDELGHAAIALPTAMNGKNLDDPIMDPIWEAAQRREAPVMLHPALLPAGAETEYSMDRSTSRPTDTTKAAIRIMASVLERYPHLTFVLAHCGGTLPFLRGRIAMFFDHPSLNRAPERRAYAMTVQEQREVGAEELFNERISHFYVDTAGTGGWSANLRFTKEVLGADKMMFGSDFPLESKSGAEMAELLAQLTQISLTEEEIQAVEAGTARKLLQRVARRD